MGGPTVLLSWRVRGRYAAMMRYPVAVAVCLCGLAVGPAAGNNPLSESCPIEWRGVPLAQAVGELAERLGVPYILDPSVSDEMMARPVRLAAVHLDGRQAFRWTVRSAGLDAVWVEGAMMIALPDRLPHNWKLTGVAGGSVRSDGSRATANLNRWEVAQARRAALQWKDAPLSRVAKDISARFGLDVVFHPDILRDQPLVRLVGQDLELAAAIRSLEEQMSASCVYDDGVLWICLRGAAASQPALPAGETPYAALASEGDDSILSRPVEIDGAEDLATALGQAAGMPCRFEGPPLGGPLRVWARGSLLEVLEVGRLLEGWEWTVTAPADAKKAILLIRTHASGRSVP